MVQEVTIASGSQLEARISAKGAEPQSVRLSGEERLWGADPAVWGRHAPVLFPLIARLRDGSYQLDGQTVKAPMHGFCRDREFEVVAQSADAVTFRTADDEGTHEVYPFAFSLEVEYAVEGSTLRKTHRVTNLGGAPMPFEVGGHEGYAVESFRGGWHVQFDGIESIGAYGMDADGVLTLPKWELALPGGKLTRTPEELGIDTIMVEGVPNSHVTLAENNGPRAVEIDFEGFPYLGIWTKAGVGAPRYLCVEPWSALPDGHFMPRELAGKPGVRVLAPGETAELGYAMTFR